MKISISIFLTLLVLSVSIDKNIYRSQAQLKGNIRKAANDPLWFDQILDHFDYRNTSTFKQRYWVYNNGFNPKIGPVFLFICGQYTCSGIPKTRQWVLNMAQRMQGLVLVLQHRYYGKSLPYGNSSFSLNNLKLLTSQQALSDLAYFIQQVNINKMYKVDGNPWIPVGGSYPGALSAWFRYKYPHLTIGAIASSAVVFAIEDYYKYDQQIYQSVAKSGDWCVKALNSSNARVQKILASQERDAFKAKFKAEKLSNEQFLFFWIDSIIDAVQYGKRTNLCNNLKAKDQQAQFNYLSDNVVSQNDPTDYGSYYVSNQTFENEKGTGSRSWNYQCCTQFGFWQTYAREHPMRSSQINIQFFKKFCSQSFGVGVWTNTFRKNIQYGGLNFKATNLLMTNGVQDPWRWASLQQSQGGIISRVADCQNCAHCVDLYTPQPNDSAELKKIREQQYLTITDWVEKYWRNKKSMIMLTE